MNSPNNLGVTVLLIIGAIFPMICEMVVTAMRIRKNGHKLDVEIKNRKITIKNNA